MVAVAVAEEAVAKSGLRLAHMQVILNPLEPNPETSNPVL